MNASDALTIKGRAISFTRNLQVVDVLTQTYQQNRVVIIADKFLPLTAGQRTAVRNEALSILARLNTTLDNVNIPTGKIGVVDTNTVAGYEVTPLDSFRDLQQFINLFDQNWVPVGVLQADGTVVADLEDNFAQALANELVTLAAGLRLLLGILNARLT